VTLLLVTVGIAIVAGVAVLIARDHPVLDEADVAARPMAWPPPNGVGAGDLESARFGVVLRGYRMDEVDRVLDDAAAALRQRDARVAELEGVLAMLVPRPAGDAAGAESGDAGAATRAPADGTPGLR